MFVKVNKEAEKMELRINEVNTKYMHVYNAYNVGHVKSFKYPGSTIITDNNMQEEIKHQINKGN